MKYRALVGLTLPANEHEATRIRDARAAGRPLPLDERKTVRVEEGKIARYIPEESIPWLLKKGAIEEVDDGA
jgi:hypothetical protein